MTTKNPFPGMNPFFERTWRDAHARLIAYLCDDLQPLIDQCHERGRYHTLDYRTDPEPPFCPEDAAWLDRILRDAGLRANQAL